MRSDLIETFKIMKEKEMYDVNREVFFFQTMTVVEEYMTENVLKDLYLM